MNAKAMGITKYCNVANMVGKQLIHILGLATLLTTFIQAKYFRVSTV